MKTTTISKQDMERIYRKIGENVKRARKAKGVSQLTLALTIGHKAVGTISMAELCINNKHFNIEHLVKIANVLDMKVEDFFQGINT